MTRLFIRFYLGVLFVLFSAGAVQNFIAQRQNANHNVRVVEAALSGGVRLARDAFGAFPEIEQQQMLEAVQVRFAYPVEIKPLAEVPKYVAERFSKGQDVVFHGTASGGMLKTPLVGTTNVLNFGPLPEFEGPSQTDLLIGYGLILALAAAAIALLLRPVARQFRLIEATALQVAAGDFNARVDEQKVASTRPLAQAFNIMAARTEALLRTQRELLQAVSHELRTPLSRIHFAVDLIRTSKTDAEREERLKSVEDATEDLDMLVGELLKYVRMETSEPALELTDIPLLPLVNDLIEKNSLLYPGKAFDIGTNLATGNLVIRADRPSFERAIGNLLANAGRFADTKVLVDAISTADQTTITIDDDGPGIPAADRARAFDPFVRLDESGTGVGLGLALVRRITGLHRGQVSADSSPLGGCRMSAAWPHDPTSES